MKSQRIQNLQVLVTIQDALLGEVHPSFRSVAVGINSEKASLAVLIVHEGVLGEVEKSSIEDIEDTLEAELGDSFSLMVSARRVELPMWFSWPKDGSDWFPVFGRYERADMISSEEVQLEC